MWLQKGQRPVIVASSEIWCRCLQRHFVRCGWVLECFQVNLKSGHHPSVTCSHLDYICFLRNCVLSLVLRAYYTLHVYVFRPFFLPPIDRLNSKWLGILVLTYRAYTLSRASLSRKLWCDIAILFSNWHFLLDVLEFEGYSIVVWLTFASPIGVLRLPDFFSII